ncbi:MAG: UDP-N-acetylglucosamine 1-carboxyvinyltransferase [Lachnospiraceae bacterium]|uniref:UDP-N-acetylglucosamine 1-carboxyvinyltransferase n=1 Tax=uncultured Acetatifactor sp. TaxID=1671927 RepID=UPI002614DFB5|nr:UDP-N-acetylglucosamine 1-carboxyvinyltransferase [uncultured Acetatifactor sp.]MCI8788620.1 UDP-N-acetylglucosamine 1-carboxyvinyltransferase [Lachnospiraceae bacterium]
MDSIRIQGGIALQGKVRVQGSKNASLPVLAATLLVGECSFIRNCPRIADVHAMVSLLKSLGCSVCWNKTGITVDSAQVRRGEMPKEAVKGMRSSLCLLGALIGRCSEVVMEHPGGCVIGERPIDLHLSALGQMGVEFEEKEGRLKAVSARLHGACICLPFPSVGATENVLLAGVMAEGDTVLEGAAREPEILTLCRFLQQCGAWIEGAGSSRLVIHGGRRLYGTDFTVPADRIVAGTYLFGCIGAGGSILLEQAPREEMETVLCAAEQMGGRVCVSKEGIYVQAPGRPLPIELATAPHPGFPTDLQSVVLAVEAKGEGCSRIQENIFENRFRVAQELQKMGARIERSGPRTVSVHGVESLCGRPVEARELRGGAALVVAGLMAEGETLVGGCQYIYRGYENIGRDFRELGARVASV